MSLYERGAPTPAFSDPDAKRILARAIEIDHARAGSVTLIDMRMIASEIGVSDDALLVAVREMQDLERARATSASMPAIPNAKALITLALASATVGVAAGVVDAVASQLMILPAAVATMLMLSGGVALFEKRTRPRSALVAFVAKNSTAWMSFGGFWALINGLAPTQTGLLAIGPVQIASITAYVWVFSTLIGSAAAFWRSRLTSDAETPPDVPATLRIRRKVATKLKAWIDVVLSRSGVNSPLPSPANVRG